MVSRFNGLETFSIVDAFVRPIHDLPLPSTKEGRSEGWGRPTFTYATKLSSPLHPCSLSPLLRITAPIHTPNPAGSA